MRGSLPGSVIHQLEAERGRLLGNCEDKDELLKFQRYEFKKIERILDSINNEDHAFLTRDDIAPIIMDSFDFIESKYCWRFPSMVIMPNHVHCLGIADKDGEPISLVKVFALLKSFTGRKINKILNRDGRVWVDENFDHWCRSPQQEEDTICYIANNPVKAGLVEKIDDWKWKR